MHCLSAIVGDEILANSSEKPRIQSSAINSGLVNFPMNGSISEVDNLNDLMEALYSESVIAKIWGIANKALDKSSPPGLFPEYTEPSGTKYIYRESDFWTSGFFPGCIYLLLERQRKYPHSFPSSMSSSLQQLPHPIQLSFACKWWTLNLHRNASLTTTHDLSFMISPWARLAWELDHDVKAYETLVVAANTLAMRYNARTKCLRSWDSCVTNKYSFTDASVDFLVIIDNMLNLDLLFWAAAKLRDNRLRAVAIDHAKTTQKHHIRSDSSTFHVVNFDQATGEVKSKMTNQGYSDSSCWARGQSWAITGFAQTYLWTHDISFLDTARACADYFLAHLPPTGVPYWDFSAPVTPIIPTDTSAAVIACYGMLLIHESLETLHEQSPYLKAALRILRSVCANHLSPAARFRTSVITIPSVEHGTSTEAGPLEVDMGEGEETILIGATINNFEFAPRKWANHGLIYADYYFLLIGNKLLDMGIGQRAASSL